MLADKGYDADALRRSLRQAGAVPALPGRVTRRRRTGYDKAALVYRSGQPDEGRRGSLPACCCGLIRASEKALKAAQLGSTARPTPRFSSTGARCSHPFAYERRINLSVQSATLLGESPAPAFDQLATLLSSTDLPATGRPSGPDSGGAPPPFDSFSVSDAPSCLPSACLPSACWQETSCNVCRRD